MEPTHSPNRARAGRIAVQLRRGALSALLSVAVVAAGMPQDARAQVAPPASTRPAPPSQAYPPPAPQGYPPSVQAQAAAMADGERDAEAETSGVAWLAIGCLVGVLGVVIGYVVEPSPPPARLLGRSPDYVTAYTQSYKYAGKQAQGKKALVGCLVGTAVVVAVYAVVLAAAANSTGP